LDLKDLPIIEPLTRATEYQLSPVHPGHGTYLKLWMDNNGVDFNALLIRCEAHEKKQAHDGDQLLFDFAAEDDDEVFTTYTGAVVKKNNQWVSNRGKTLFRRIPEATALWLEQRFGAEQKYGQWKLAATDFTVLVIHHCWPKEQIIFADENTRLLYEYLLKRFYAQTARANMQARFKVAVDPEVPELPHDYDEHATMPLSDYQRVAYMMGLGHEATALHMDRGTGKTPVSIARICTEAKRIRAGLNGDSRMMYVLIICPNQVRLNWQREFQRFATIAGKTTILRGTQLKRVQLFRQAMRPEDDCAFTAVIVSYDTLANDLERLFSKVNWDLVVADEAHSIKNSTTKRARALFQLRDNSTARMTLTGTPVTNIMLDLWAQLEFLAEGLSGFRSLAKFKEFHGRWEQNGQGAVESLVGLKNVALLQERLTRVAFAITKEEAGLNLPDKVYDIHEVEMTPAQAEIYVKVRDQIVVEIEAGLRTKTLSTQHILTQLLRLAQICSGHVKWNDDVDEDTGIVLQEGYVEQIDNTNPKLEAVVDMMKESEAHEKTVIWACFVEDCKQIYDRLIAEGYKGGYYYGATPEKLRDEFVDRFNNEDDFVFLVCNPASAGEGLNLLGYNPDRDDQETYCNHEIFFSANWSYVQRAQAEDRVHRRGTKMPVRITDLVVPNTIDEEIRARVTAKGEHARDVQDVQGLLKKVLKVDIDLTLLGGMS